MFKSNIKMLFFSNVHIPELFINQFQIKDADFGYD